MPLESMVEQEGVRTGPAGVRVALELGQILMAGGNNFFRDFDVIKRGNDTISGDIGRYPGIFRNAAGALDGTGLFQRRFNTYLNPLMAAVVAALQF